MSAPWSNLAVVAGSTVGGMVVFMLTFGAITFGMAQVRAQGWGRFATVGLLGVCMAAGTALAWEVHAGMADKGDGFIVFVLMFFLIGPLAFLALAFMLPPRSRRGGPRRGGQGLAAACFAGAGLCALGLVAVVSLPAATDGAVRGADLGPLVTPLLALVAGLAVAGWRVRRQRRAISASAATQADPRPPVLYLREFRFESQPFVVADAQSLRPYLQNAVRWVPQWLQPGWLDVQAVTAEEYLAAAMTQQLGPFVALGNPLDELPALGAARDYADDGQWRVQFLDLAQRAQAVLLAPGTSDAMAWELQALHRAGLAHKLFVAVGSDAFRPTTTWWVGRLRGWRNPDWLAFRALLQAAGFSTPPQAPRPWSVLAFDAAGRGQWVADGTAVDPVLYAGTVGRHLDAQQPLSALVCPRPPPPHAAEARIAQHELQALQAQYAAPPAPALPLTLAQEMDDISSGRNSRLELRWLGALLLLLLPVATCVTEALPQVKLKFGFEASFADHLAITAVAGALSFLLVVPRATRWMAVLSGSLAGMGAYTLCRLLLWSAERVRPDLMFICVLLGAAPGAALMWWRLTRYWQAQDAQDAQDVARPR